MREVVERVRDETLSRETIYTVRRVESERRQDLRLGMLLVLSLFQKAAKAPCVGEQ
jgi:hypothetical protein